jgi:hypothetical protein
MVSKTKSVVLAAVLLALVAPMLMAAPAQATIWFTVERVCEWVKTVYYSNGYYVKWYIEYVMQQSSDGIYARGWVQVIKVTYRYGVKQFTEKLGWWDSVRYYLYWNLRSILINLKWFIASKFFTIPLFGYFPPYVTNWICQYCSNCGWCYPFCGPTSPI